MSDAQNSPQTQLEAPRQPRKRKSIKPPVVQSAVMAKYMTGQSKTQISKDLGIARNTIDSILSASEIEQHILSGRSDCVRMIPRSIRVIDQKLEKGSETAALAILRGTQVLQNQQVVTNQTNIQANTWIMMKDRKAGESERVLLDAKPVEANGNSDNQPQ